MSDLKTAARRLERALKIANKAIEKYAAAALAVGREAGNPTARGFDAKQVRQRLKAHVIAALSPKPVHGLPEPILQFDGAPEARRFAATRPLPGLS